MDALEFLKSVLSYDTSDIPSTLFGALLMFVGREFVWPFLIGQLPHSKRAARIAQDQSLLDRVGALTAMGIAPEVVTSIGKENDEFKNKLFEHLTSVAENAIDLREDAELLKTQADMTQYAYVAQEAAERKATQLSDMVLRRLEESGQDERAKAFSEVQDNWLTYAKLDATFEANLYAEGGSMWPSLYSSALEERYQERVLVLRGILKGPALD